MVRCKTYTFLLLIALIDKNYNFYVKWPVFDDSEISITESVLQYAKQMIDHHQKSDEKMEATEKKFLVSSNSMQLYCRFLVFKHLQ